jgi:1-acyl-sn-glycerol-3-phosphate acyltransferase
LEFVTKMNIRRWINYCLRSHAYRIPATGFGFLVFGLGAALSTISIFPLIYILPLNRRRKEKLTRHVIAAIFMSYIRLLRSIGLLTYELKNTGKLREPGQLIVANHPSLLDVVFLIAMTGDSSCIVKGALWKNPFTAMAVRLANYISNNDALLFSRCVDLLNRGGSLIVFPEGTRSRPGERLKFHRGLSNIALSSIQKITPVLISCEPATLMKNRHWHDISQEPPHFTIEVLSVIRVEKYMADGQLQSAAARQLNRDLEFYFNQLSGRVTDQVKREKIT